VGRNGVGSDEKFNHSHQSTGNLPTWRVIARISYFDDVGSGLRNNYIVPFFEAMRLKNTATGIFESESIDPIQAANNLSQVLQALANPRQFSDVDELAALKHLWVYIDRVDDKGDRDDTEHVGGPAMSKYQINSDTLEDASASNLSDAMRLAREFAVQVPLGEAVSIEHEGRVVTTFVRSATGEIVERLPVRPVGQKAALPGFDAAVGV
jgi:hypothetical protein